MLLVRGFCGTGRQRTIDAVQPALVSKQGEQRPRAIERSCLLSRQQLRQQLSSGVSSRLLSSEVASSPAGLVFLADTGQGS